MRASANGINLIASFEGLRLQAYRDAVGVWTIGYGHTKGVKPGMTVTKARARELLRADVAWAEQAVNKLGLTFTVNEFDALVSAVFNLGPGILDRGRSLGAALRTDNRGRAANALLFYVNAGKLRNLPGLVRRRGAERKLFLTPAPVLAPGGHMTTRELQSALRAIGWPVKVDGKLGPRTRQAVRDFQRGYLGFGGAFTAVPLQVDGVAGRRTCRALRYSVRRDGRCSPHFKFREFADHQTRWIRVHRDLLAGLEKARAVRGPIGVLSGFRDPSRKIGAANSQHHHGNAIDPMLRLGSVDEVRRLGVFSGIGHDRLGVRHVDVRHVGPNPTGGTPGNPTVFADNY